MGSEMCIRDRRAGTMNKSCRNWRNSAANNTWAEFKAHFSLAHRELRETTTTTADAGFHTAHNIQATTTPTLTNYSPYNPAPVNFMESTPPTSYAAAATTMATNGHPSHVGLSELATVLTDTTTQLKQLLGNRQDRRTNKTTTNKQHPPNKWGNYCLSLIHI